MERRRAHRSWPRRRVSRRNRLPHPALGAKDVGRGHLVSALAAKRHPYSQYVITRTDVPAAPICGARRRYDSTDASPPALFCPSPRRRCQDRLPTLYVIGDSTANNVDHRGWADPFAAYFDSSKIHVVNRARAGRSSRTFVTEGSGNRSATSYSRATTCSFNSGITMADLPIKIAPVVPSLASATSKRFHPT